MNREALLKRQDRTRAIVEGALLGDIAIVFLLMRAFLPLPGVRQILRAVATVPFVMLTQRRGLRLTILAAIASYILFSALVGPILALAAVDIGVAGILAGMGRRFGLGIGLNTLITGPIYAFFDLIVPTVVSVVVFRYPVKQLSDAARNFVKAAFNLFIYVLNAFHASPGVIHQMNLWKASAADHWQVAWVVSLALLGILTMYLAVLVAETVLRQVPEQTLARQRATT
jgi:uncharacterized protein YybS (DUF2232 family)